MSALNLFAQTAKRLWLSPTSVLSKLFILLVADKNKAYFFNLSKGIVESIHTLKLMN